MKNKVKSFTLSELLVAMIITLIVIGIAFTVLNLVKKQITTIQKNYNKTNEMSFFKEQITLDFNKSSDSKYSENKLILISEMDTVYYNFSEDFALRNLDTLKVKMQAEKLFFLGDEVKEGAIDAISFTEKTSKTVTSFFVFKRNDATLFMNQDGF